MRTRTLGLVAIVVCVVAGAWGVGEAPIPKDPAALKAEVIRLRKQVAQQQEEIRTLKAQLAAAQPAQVAAATQPKPDRFAEPRMRLARLAGKKSWLQPPAVGVVGRFAAEKVRVDSVLSNNEAVIAFEGYDAKFNTWSQCRVLLIGQTGEWADGAMVTINDGIWISGTKRVNGTTYFVAERIPPKS